jgi:hypothetical protein
MGKPQQLKNDNVPACISAAFQQFCETYQIHHITGVLYNPQGQAIVECAHGHFQNANTKIKRGR